MDRDDLLVNLLSEKQFRFPLDGEDDLPAQLAGVLKAYVEAIARLPHSEAAREARLRFDVQFLADDIVRTLQAQLHGTWHRAFSNFVRLAASEPVDGCGSGADFAAPLPPAALSISTGW